MNDDNPESDHRIKPTAPDEVVAVLQYPVPTWVKNLGTVPGAIFGNSNDSANPREWRETLPAGKWSIGRRDGGFVGLHLELIGFRERQRARDAKKVAALVAVTPAREPNDKLISELTSLLDQARSGDLRGLAFVAYLQCTVDHRYGNVGDYSLADLALGIKLLELEFDSIVTSGATPD